MKLKEAMAVGIAITSQDGEYYNGKLTLFVIVSCMVAAIGGVIFGYDIGISGLLSLYQHYSLCLLFGTS